MAETEYLEARNLEFQEARDALADKDVEVFNIIILNDSIEFTQAKIKALQS